MNYGDIGKRIVAAIIDSVIVSILVWVMVYILFVTGVWTVFWNPGSMVLSPLVGWLYYILMEGGSMHATIGKRAMDLYVADANGIGITYSDAILRVIGKILTAFTLGIGFVVCLFNDQKQCLHDMVAKTYVLGGSAVPSYGGSSGGPKLVCVNGPLAGMVYNVGSSGVIIGRDHVSCQIVIPSSYASVSRVHCYVTYNPASGMFVLNDRNSTHGTYLANGRRVIYSQPAALSRGDRFYLATPNITFEVR